MRATGEAKVRVRVRVRKNGDAMGQVIARFSVRVSITPDESSPSVFYGAVGPAVGLRVRVTVRVGPEIAS